MRVNRSSLCKVWFCFPAVVTFAIHLTRITVSNVLSRLPAGSLFLLFRHWTLVAQSPFAAQATIFCHCQMGHIRVFIVWIAFCNNCSKRGHVESETNICACSFGKITEIEAASYINMIMHLVQLMWKSAFEPKAIFSRYSHLEWPWRMPQPIQIKPVELNWVKHRTSHELNSCKLIELNWVRLMWSTAFNPALSAFFF